MSKKKTRKIDKHLEDLFALAQLRAETARLYGERNVLNERAQRLRAEAEVQTLRAQAAHAKIQATVRTEREVLRRLGIPDGVTEYTTDFERSVYSWEEPEK